MCKVFERIPRWSDRNAKCLVARVCFWMARTLSVKVLKRWHQGSLFYIIQIRATKLAKRRETLSSTFFILANSMDSEYVYLSYCTMVERKQMTLLLAIIQTPHQNNQIQSTPPLNPNHWKRQKRFDHPRSTSAEWIWVNLIWSDSYKKIFTKPFHHRQEKIINLQETSRYLLLDQNRCNMTAQWRVS